MDYSETYSDRQFTLNTRKGLRKHKMPKIVFERDWKHREQQLIKDKEPQIVSLGSRANLLFYVFSL